MIISLKNALFALDRRIVSEIIEPLARSMEKESSLFRCHVLAVCCFLAAAVIAENTLLIAWREGMPRENAHGLGDADGIAFLLAVSFSLVAALVCALRTPLVERALARRISLRVRTSPDLDNPYRLCGLALLCWVAAGFVSLSGLLGRVDGEIGVILMLVFLQYLGLALRACIPAYLLAGQEN